MKIVFPNLASSLLHEENIYTTSFYLVYRFLGFILAPVCMLFSVAQLITEPLLRQGLHYKLTETGQKFKCKIEYLDQAKCVCHKSQMKSLTPASFINLNSPNGTILAIHFVNCIARIYISPSYSAIFFRRYKGSW